MHLNFTEGNLEDAPIHSYKPLFAFFPSGPIGLLSLLSAKAMGAAQIIVTGKIKVLER